TENARGETALMFAAAADRADVVKLLLTGGADPKVASRIVDLAGVVAPEDALQKEIRDKENEASAKRTGNAPAAPPVDRTRSVAGLTRPYEFNELIGKQGGLTPLLFAARQGAARTAEVLVAGGADVNTASAADGTTPLVMAAINGQFDLAKYF